MMTSAKPLETTRKLRIDARKRLTKALAAELPELVKHMEFYPINSDSWSAYEILDLGAFKIVMSVKTDPKKLNKASR